MGLVAWIHLNVRSDMHLDTFLEQNKINSLNDLINDANPKKD